MGISGIQERLKGKLTGERQETWNDERASLPRLPRWKGGGEKNCAVSVPLLYQKLILTELTELKEWEKDEGRRSSGDDWPSENKIMVTE